MKRNRCGALRALCGGAVFSLAAGCAGSAPPPAAPPAEEVQIGYGTQARKDITGAVASVTGDQVRDMRVGRVEELLEGRAAGLQVTRGPRGDLSLRIRGNRSLLGNNEPLVVIDGVPISAASVGVALTGIAPANVARIDILKDAGSTAAYGARGSNGVILITTKRASR